MRRIGIFATMAILVIVQTGYSQETKPESQRIVIQVESAKTEVESKTEPMTPPVRARVFEGVIGGTANLWGGGKSAGDWYIEHHDKIVKLSDEQKQKIKSVFELRDAAMKEFQASIEAKAKAAAEGMSEAFKSQDKETIAKTQKAYHELYTPMHEIMKKSQAALQSILTAEQRAKLQDNQLAAQLAAFAPGIQLSDEQRKQIKEGLGQSASDQEAYGRKLPELIDKTLTQEQISAVLKQRAADYLKAMYGNANLTEEQQKKADEKVAELIKDHKKTVNFETGSYQKLIEHVNGLLTAEQKQATKTQRWIANAGGGGFGGGNRPPAPNADPTAQSRAVLWSEQRPIILQEIELKLQDPKAGESVPANVTVMKSPSGTFHITIHEVGEGKEEKPQHKQRLETLMHRMAGTAVYAFADPKAGMRERVKRQRELTKKASKLMEKIDELGEGNSTKAQDLWEDLERVEAKLQQTFGTYHLSIAPGQPAGGAIKSQVLRLHSAVPVPGAPATPAIPNPAPKPNAPGASSPPAGSPTSGAPTPGFKAVAEINIGAGAAKHPAANPDVVKELQALRQQMEEFKAQLQKLKQEKDK